MFAVERYSPAPADIQAFDFCRQAKPLVNRAEKIAQPETANFFDNKISFLNHGLRVFWRLGNSCGAEDAIADIQF